MRSIPRRNPFLLAFSQPGSLAGPVSNSPPFHPYGPAHLVVMGLTVGLPVFFWATARGPGREGYRKGVRFALAALLLLNWIGYNVIRAADGLFTPAQALPMQLCDWATLAMIAALVTRRRGIAEVCYFWGLSGTLQAIITPNLQAGFPSPRFFDFFIGHCGVVVGVMFLTLVEGLRPRPWSIVTALIWSEVYFVTALVVNYLTGANYGFLNYLPAGKSLLDYLSSNHLMYLVELHLLELAFYLVLYSPFWIMDMLHGGEKRLGRPQPG